MPRGKPGSSVNGDCAPFSRHKMVMTSEGYSRCVRCRTLGKDAPTEARFWDKVDKSGDCWFWRGFINPNGRGLFLFRGRVRNAHQVAWILTYGELPPNFGNKRGNVVLCHTCDNRACMKPAHLFLGSQKENMEDKIRKGRNGRNSLPLDVVAEVRRLAQEGRSNKDIAQYLHLRYDAVTRITSGRCWKALR
jgi:hypothetical protein